MERGISHLTLPGDILDKDKISPAALSVIRTLNSAGYEAYLVGGGVRDLLTDKIPKDFDVVTNARPETVKRLCRRSVIIGRRFKLVHVTEKGTLIEVATFRKGMTYEDSDTVGMLTSDNTYSTDITDDAIRRDFSINGFYYSPADNVIHDYLGGVSDLLHERVDIVGDPDVRFSEDPVRMIRAYRFSAKLGFSITPRTRSAIFRNISGLAQVNNNRMYEEFNKMFLTGHGETSFQLLMRDGIMQNLLTDMGPLIKSRQFFDFISCCLRNTDTRHAEGKHNMPHFLYAVMLWPLTRKLYMKMGTIGKYSSLKETDRMAMAGKIVLERQSVITKIPEFVAQDIIDIWKMQIILTDEEIINNQEQVESVVWKEIFRAGLEFLMNRVHMDEKLERIITFWTDTYYNHIPQSLRTRKALISSNKIRNQEARGSRSDGDRSRRKSPSGIKRGRTRTPVMQ
ncbi:polynucleotide adenylyltransferase PcnB [Succinimonas amylolytica]|uniref:polynucleotide adenylyltransferase PcnB n=1 Tax=Succinimonas amylolytica TaxID=83769 RepID=UPI0023A888AB